MAAFGDIFEDAQAPGVPMAAPGLPLAALGGNPATIATGTAAILGAQSGAMLGSGVTGAIGAAMGRPMVDPAAIMANRQKRFAELYRSELESGKSDGEAFLSAAELARRQGVLSSDEYLRARGAGLERRDKEGEALTTATDFVRKSDAFENFSKSSSLFDQMKEIAKRGEFGNQSANDFALILSGLKILDPGSVVSQNELANARFAINGARQLKLMGINVNAITDYAAGRGKAFELTPEQKEKWLKAISGAVDAQRSDLENVYLTARDGYTASWGNARQFEQSLQSVQDLLEKRAYESVAELAGEGLISQGRGFNNPTDRLNAGIKAMPDVYGDLLQGASEAGWGVIKNLFFGDGMGPSNSSAPRMEQRRNLGGEKTSGVLSRMIDPRLVNVTLQEAYQTDNAMHAMTLDALYGDGVSATFDQAFTAIAKTPKRKRKPRRA